MEYEVFAKGRYGGSVEPYIHPRHSFDDTARIAIELVRSWGMVAARIDGEDSAGRAKLELQSPQQVVDRAMETAERLMKAIGESGHLISIPPYEQLREMAREEDNRN